MEISREHIGKRLLIKEDRYLSDPVEIDLLEMSPSGKYLKFKFLRCDDTTYTEWVRKGEYELVEVLDSKSTIASEWNKQFDPNLTTSLTKDCITTENYQNQKLKEIEEWNKGLYKLDQEAKEQREIREKASLRADELEEMMKRWNKLNLDQKMKIYEESLKQSEDKYPIEPLYKKVGTLNKPSDSDSDNCWNS